MLTPQSSRAHGLGAQRGIAVDDVVGACETGIAHLSLFVAIIAHYEMHGLVASVDEVQQCAVAFAGGFSVFLN